MRCGRAKPALDLHSLVRRVHACRRARFDPDLTVETLPPLRNPRVPSRAPPPGACDAHFHVIGPRALFPFAPERAFTPEDVPIEWAMRMHATLGIERGVVVQCNPHGTDNSALLDALARYPQRLRGVAIVRPDIAREALRRMADLGIRALRFHHMPASSGFSPFGLEAFAKLAPVMVDLGLHVQLMIDANTLDDALSAFDDWPLPVVIDHMGNVDASLGVRQPAVTRLCRLLRNGRIWVKVSGAYRISARYPDYDDAGPVLQALVRANPERTLWGSDWPHTRLASNMPDDGHLLDLFNDWVDDEATRRRILVDNPKTLYGFD